MGTFTRLGVKAREEWGTGGGEERTRGGGRACGGEERKRVEGVGGAGMSSDTVIVQWPLCENNSLCRNPMWGMAVSPMPIGAPRY